MDKAKIRHANRHQTEMHIAALDDLLPDDHPAREIWAYVEQLDLGALEEAIRSRQGRAGAPAFDPRTLLCLWLYATVDGVGSARRLSRLCEEHIVYRWIAGGDVINYHTLSSFRVASGGILDDLLVASVAMLAAEGFVDPNTMTLAVDGMRVRASAGRGSARRRPTLEESLGKARQRVAQLRETEVQEPTGARKAAAGKRAARERVERLEKALEVMEHLEKKPPRTDRPPREPRVSPTDPDATMLRMANGGKDMAHNLQFAIDVDSRVITHVEVPWRSSDTGTLGRLIDGHAQRHGQRPVAVLADQGFFKYADIIELERNGVAVHMPDLYPQAKTRNVKHKDANLLNGWLERIATAAAKKLYKQRPSTVEWVNARVRAFGLQQLTVRGQTKVRVIGLWHALAHNIQRTLCLRRQALGEQPA